MTIKEIQTVCFVGAGNMGCFNAMKAAISGYTVTLYDVDEDHLQQALSRCKGFAAYLAGSGYCLTQAIPAALERITSVADLAEATADADLVSESVFERLDLKREVHQKLDEVCPEKTLLTTNSSYLLLSEIEDVVGRGDRIAVMHSYLGSPLVDIVGGQRTSAATLDTLERYVQSIGAVPLLLNKEYPGYVLNAVLGPVLTTAMYLVAEGAASCEAVDRAWMSHRCAPMGPFGILDIIGLNLVYDSWLNRDDEGPIPGLRPRVLSLLKPAIDRDEPLVLALVASAVVAAAHDVAAPVDIDKAWMTGTSLDCGPFEILEEMGEENFLALFSGHLAAGRFDPARARLVIDYFA